ncbi:DUF2867 domain-containing protein [Nocardiopsis lucentensis]|uniref:DUF2867 domain-containing protein n=1 Tax=Nocardiopsis lucentensis TaxID=53441 RepID=UPI000349999B|nr:DUF2867 domain-containing protein [Nocardiopsis lucentensis]
MRLPHTAHTARPWRIHELTRDFRLEDVWSFRTPGAGPDDFPAMLAALREAGGPERQSAPVRFLFALRWKLGALFGWDRPTSGVGARVRSLRDRLPADLRRAPNTPGSGKDPFTPVYELGDECASELANTTVHTVMHLGWVPTDRGEYELRMAALVKPNGLFGRVYMAAIAPFRHLIVYPALTRQWEAAWRDRDRPRPAGGTPQTVDGAVGTGAVPASVLALSSLSRVDYIDMFTLSTDVDATPEQWARAMFGDVPDPLARLIWQGLLGLRLSRGPSPDTVAGWRITGRGDDWIRLATASRSTSDNLVVRVADGRVSLVTCRRYGRPLDRLVWTPLSAVHRRLAPGVLRGAVTAVRAPR